MALKSPPASSLGQKTIRGVLVTVGGQWSKTLLQLCSTVLLARMLAPEDFGLLAMVAAIVGLAELVRDFGLSGAIVQAKEIGDRLWSSLLWLSVALGTGLMLLVAASAPFIAALYGEPRLILITLVLSPALLINGVCTPLQTKLQRDLRFTLLAKLEVSTMVLSVGAAIAGASLGWGVWSLVAMNAAGALYRLGVLVGCAKPHFGPPRISRSVLPFLTSGGSIFGSQLLNYAARNVDNVAVGSFLGPAVLGYYSRAYSLLIMPLSQINGPLSRVALPVLSRLQDQPERFRRYISASLLVISYVSLPAFAVLAGVAFPLVELLLGPNWSPTAAIFQLLAIAGLAQPLSSAVGWLFISLNRMHQQLLYSLVAQPLLIGSYFAGMGLGGVQGLALVYSLTSVALLVPSFYFAIRGTFVGWRDVVLPILKPLLLAPLVFLSAWATTLTLNLPPAAEVLLGGLAGLAILLVAWLLVPQVRRDAREILAYIGRARTS
jgi:O-antigen/teichoic acid export membrane protein